jgi:hypothetical protein
MGCFDVYCKICGVATYSYPMKDIDLEGYNDQKYEWLDDCIIVTPTHMYKGYSDDGYGKVEIDNKLILLNHNISNYESVVYGYIIHAECLYELKNIDNLFVFLQTHKYNIIVNKYHGQHYDFKSTYESNRCLLHKKNIKDVD